MPKNLRRPAPEFIVQNGKPRAVIIDINEYRRLLEQSADRADVALLNATRKKRLKFRPLTEFLADR